MTRFQNLRQTKPPRVISLPEGYFRENNSHELGLPGTRIGIRRLSIGELENCYEEAKMYQADGIPSYNRSLMLNVVAQALTMPDDVRKPYLKAGDLEARSLFTPSGIEYLYDIVLQLHLSVTPIFEEITNENLELLFKLLKTRTISPKIRRMLSYILDEISK